MAKEFYRQLSFTFTGKIKEDKESRKMTQEEIDEYEHMTEDLDQITIFEYLDSMEES